MDENTPKTEHVADAITAAQAKENRLLILEDLAKIDFAIAQAKAQIAMFETRKAECGLALADIDRREAGVVYPENPKTEAAKPAEAAKPVEAAKPEETQA